MTNIRFHREALSDDQRDITKWPMVDTTVLSETDAALFERRFAAIRDYLVGQTYRAIRQAHQISPTRLWELLKRCFKKHDDGRIYGTRALVPRVRIKPYERRAEVKVRDWGAHGGHSGALAKLFERFPDIKELVDDLYLKRAKPGVIHEPRIPVKSIHKRFLDKCRQLGLKEDYPFTTKWLGLRALGKYLQRLANEETERVVMARYGANAARKIQASGDGGVDKTMRPFQRVQCDGHRIDGLFTIWVKHPDIGEVPVELPRLWLLVITDVFSRAVLGYVIVLSLEYSARDVMRCIQRAVAPWKRRSFTIKGLKYPERGGFPSGVNPELAWVAWDEFWFDNAKAHLADLTIDMLISKLRCRPHAGAVGAIERRAMVERFFLTFEENGIHRLASTTGSHPRDPRRDKPEAKALKYDMKLEHLEELVEVMLAQYNGTPHTSLGYRTPLEVLEHYLATGGEVRRVAEKDRDAATFLHEHDVRIVRGSLKGSRKPYIEYEGAVYRNEVLARSFDLVGTALTLHVDTDDLRCLKAFLPNGTELGVLSAQGSWARTPHSLETRRAIQSRRHRKLIAFTEMDDAVQIYHDQLGRESLTNKRVRPRYGKTRRDMEKPGDHAARNAAAIARLRQPSPPSVKPAVPRKTVTY